MGSLTELYSAYFKLFRSVGVFPFTFDPDTTTVHCIQSRRQRVQCAFNLVVLFCTCVSAGSLLAYNHFTEYKHETLRNGYLIQSLWFTGAVVVLIIYGTVLHFAEDIASMLTTSLRLEQFVFGEMKPIQRGPQQKRRIHLFKLQLLITGSAIVFNVLLLTPFTIVFPRFPPFLNSWFIIAKGMKAGAGGGETQLTKYFDTTSATAAAAPTIMVLNQLIKSIFHVREVYFSLLAWSTFASFDIFLNAIFSTIGRAIDHAQTTIQISATRERALNLYAGLRSHLTSIQSTLGALIFLVELLNLCLNVLVMYSAIAWDNPFLVIFFTFDSFAITLRMYVFYLPISSMYVKAQIFMKNLKRNANANGSDTSGAGTQSTDTGTSSMDNKILARKLMTIRHVVFRPMGLHRITPSSIFDYSLATLSYLIVIIQS